MGTVIQFDPDVTAELMIELEVVDPCPGAIVNFDSGLVIHDLIAAAGRLIMHKFDRGARRMHDSLAGGLSDSLCLWANV